MRGPGASSGTRHHPPEPQLIAENRFASVRGTSHVYTSTPPHESARGAP
jgi:hypothetical protein